MRSRSRSGPAIGFDPGAEYATDCSPEAARAAPIAVALAEAFSADLDVLNVVHSNDIDHPDQLHRLEQHFYGAVAAIMPHDASKICHLQG